MRGDFKITTREVLLSTVILCGMIGLGILISSNIEDSVARRNQALAASVQIDTQSEFKYCIDTEVGRFISGDTLKAMDPVNLPELSGYYMYIEKIKERYTMHTQVYTTSDGKGHTTTHTRHYWSWDRVGFESFGASELRFLGQRVKVGYPDTHHQKTNRMGNIRYRYFVVDTNVPGVLLGMTEDKVLKDLRFIQGKTADEYIKDSLGNESMWVILFWVLWTILSLGCIFLFYYGEYEWLERD